MLIAKVKNNEVIEVSDYRLMFPNVSFPASGPTSSFLEENECLLVSVWKQHDSKTEKLVSVSPYIENGMVYTVAIQLLSQEDIDRKKSSEWSQIRTRRNKMLLDSDWTQLADVSFDAATKLEWATYRQNLRDITQQEDPFNITWPKIPGTVENSNTSIGMIFTG